MPVAEIATKEDFKAFVGELQAKPCFRKPLGWGIFRQQTSQLNSNKVLTGTYPTLNWQGQNLGSFACYAEAAGLFDPSNVALWQQPEVVLDVTPQMAHRLEVLFFPYWEEARGGEHLNVQIAKNLSAVENYGSIEYAKVARSQKLASCKLVITFDDVPCTSLATAYMKLTALSRRFVKPLELNLQGIFGLLPNVAWSGGRAIDLDWLRENEVRLKMAGEYPSIDFVDKFPRLLMQIIPDDDIRILSTHNVRFGAHLAKGTTVMPGASYVNFNAGTLGMAMVEGRISSSATIGEGTDVGGGASILGTLSGPNKTPVRIGNYAFLGANSVTGISLGDYCVIDAGMQVLKGGKFYIPPDVQAQLAEVNPQMEWGDKSLFKGSELVGLNELHFRQDSQTGKFLVLRSSRKVELNTALHA